MRIKEIREAGNIMQKKMAADLGIAANTLSQYENGKREPDIETTKRIAEYLGVSVDTLVGGDGMEKAPTDKGGREVGFDDFDYALHNESKELSEEKKQMLLNMARFMRQEEKGK